MDGVVFQEVEDSWVEGNVVPGENGGEPVAEALSVFFVRSGEFSVFFSHDVARGGNMMIVESFPEDVDGLPSVAGVSTKLVYYLRLNFSPFQLRGSNGLFYPLPC